MVLNPPTFETDPERTSFLVRLPVRSVPEGEGAKSVLSRDQVGTKSNEKKKKAQDKAQDELSVTQFRILAACQNSSRSSKEILIAAGYSQRTGNFKRTFERLIEDRLIEMTLPEKPTSRYQKYRTTQAGVAAVHKSTGSVEQ